MGYRQHRVDYSELSLAIEVLVEQYQLEIDSMALDLGGFESGHERMIRVHASHRNFNLGVKSDRSVEVLQLCTSRVSQSAYHFISGVSSQALVDLVVDLLIVAHQTSLRMCVVVVVVVEFASCLLR